MSVFFTMTGREHGIPALDWVIVGGESGARARPFDLEWARDIVAQCRSAGVAPFVKQLGEVWSRNHGYRGLHGTSDRHGGDPEGWPEDLRVREWPVPA
jgi:protein gp37